MAQKGVSWVLLCSTIGVLLGCLAGSGAAQGPASAPSANAPASAQTPVAGTQTTLAVPPLSQICPGSLNVTIAGPTIVESPTPFTAVPASWQPLNGGEALSVGGNGSYIAVGNRQQPSDGVSIDVSGMQIGTLYKLGAYVKNTGSTNEKIRMRFNYDDVDFKCAAMVSVVQSDCYTLVLGGMTGPSYNGPLTNVKLEITGNALPGNQTTNTTSPPYEIDIYSIAVVGVNRSSWLDDVRQRTDLARRRDVVVTVVDGAGNPVPNASVVINQTQQTFPFGDDLQDVAYTNAQYREWFAGKWGGGYSWTAYADALKWYSMQPSRDNLTYTKVVNLQEYANNNSISVRGHTVFWDDVGTLQPWLTSIDDPAELFSLMQARANDVVTPFKDSIEQWDPANEILHKRYFNEKLGFDVRPWYFNVTKRLDPTAVTFLSDYNMVEACDDSTVWPERAMDFVTYLRDQGGPVSAFAAQGQFTQIQPYVFRYGLDKLGQFGIPIWMTEINLRLVVEPYSEQLQRDSLELIWREAFAHPAVKGMLLSQTWTGENDWEQNNGTCSGNKCLYNLDFSPRLAGQLWEDLYYREWRTLNVTGTTDANGQFGFRGYAGEYNIVVNGSGNATYRYQSSSEFIVYPVNTTTDPSLYLFELTTPYVTLLNGSVAANGTGPASNVTDVFTPTPFYNISSTLQATTPYINIAQGTDNIAANLAHVEKPPIGNASTFRVVPGQAQQVVRVVAPLVAVGGPVPVSTINPPTLPPNAIGPIPTGSGASAPSSGQSAAAPSPA